ncbi:hypothetical protein BS47DRAFT_1443418 [Hydnum rufescens UP504]|uniref:BTB/POZ domain-containing protein n=1 Tax=Hydnum rufescens UP504 TaxID=1448309 RepID=A0A9P6B2A3_9AGAM|nr:hypothetical protein BS47DRAFT_1443418 [Hydnum rufescens UP504]
MGSGVMGDQYSGFFQDMLSLGFEKQLEGYSNSLLVVLADVHIADWDFPAVTAEEFELALSVMYPELLIKNPQKSSAQWCKVLDVAQRWQSPLLRDTAIAHLTKSDLRASMHLAISTKYSVPGWLPDILPELCLPRTFPPEDITLLSPSLIVPFFSAREEFCNDLVSLVLSQAMCYDTRCSWSATERGRLCDHLRESLSSTSDLGNSSITEAFQERLRSPISCVYCTRACKAMLSACADFGRSLVRERSLPREQKKKKKNSREGCRPAKIRPRTCEPLHV